MRNTKALVAKPTPESYQIPQTVTSPVERREIRQFINMRLEQIKGRLDRIYRFNKDRFVDAGYEAKAAEIKAMPKLKSLIREYNKDNAKLAALMERRESLKDEIESLCSRKQHSSEKLAEFARKNEGLSYRPSTYGSETDRHALNTIEPEKLMDEKEIRDALKADFDSQNSAQMEQRNRKIHYLYEKIEERLLFGSRDEIQKLFCELEMMNAAIEQELTSLGLDAGLEPIQEEG